MHPYWSTVKYYCDENTNLDSDNLVLSMGIRVRPPDVLNSHFRATLNITASKASGLSAAYFGAYFLCPLTISGWIDSETLRLQSYLRNR